MSERNRGGSNRAAALQRLAQRKEQGISAIDDYQVEEDNVYDEVSEDVANEIQRKRIREDDFVVDDDGSGYMETGQEIFDGSAEYSEEEEEDQPKKKKKKAAAGQNIVKMLQKTANQLPKPHLIEDRPLVKDLSDNLVDHLLAQASKEAVKTVKSSARPSIPKPAPTVVHSSKEAKELEALALFGNNQEDQPLEFDDLPVEMIENDGQVKVNRVQTGHGQTTVAASSFLPKFNTPALTEATVTNSKTLTGRNWEAEYAANSKSQAVQTTVPSLSANIRPEQVLESDGSLNFFWFDAYENNSYHGQRGVLYLFGKVQVKDEKSSTPRYVSCCLTVNGQERNVFVLPRSKRMDFTTNTETDEEVDMGMVFEEMEAIRRKNKIASWKCKEVQRHYAFENPDVPAESNYLKIVYGFDQPELPQDLSGETFSMIFGAKTSVLEHFLLKRKIMGPCWLRIENPQFSARNISWCKLEIAVDTPKNITNFKPKEGEKDRPSPPLVVMCCSMKTFMNRQSNEIVMIGAHIYSNVSIDDASGDAKQDHSTFSVVRKMDSMPLPQGFKEAVDAHNSSNPARIELCPTERALLNYFVAQLHRFDPDVLVGHNFIGFDLDVLLHRMKHHKVDHWSRVGRLKRTVWPKMQSGAGGQGESTFEERMIASGRILCDTYLAAKEHILKAKSYSLSNLSLTELEIQRQDINFEQIPQYFWETGSLINLVKHTIFDALLAAKLMFKIQILPLSKQLTNLAGNMWSKTLTGARADRNEHLLLHEFHERKYIVPDKVWKKGVRQVEEQEDDEDKDARRPGTTGRRKPAYLGGLVLEPKKGFYDKFVVMLDFNSLYPSIIQEYNIDFSTVVRHYDAPVIADDGSQINAEDVMPALPEAGIEVGVLPRLLENLVKRRRQIKNLISSESKSSKPDSSLVSQLDVRQRALKLTANSMYGCLGFSHSRFYAKPLAMLITSKGREILQDTVNMAQESGLEVIYGDTDSIMIYTNTDKVEEVKKIGNEFKKMVNVKYNKLEIELDGMFKRMLLLKKKKYAALVAEEKGNGLKTWIETKGLDMVRRDWCGLSRDVSETVLNHLLLDTESSEATLNRIHEYLVKVGEECRANVIPVDKYVINKQLTKAAKDYHDAGSQPHVQVAKRMEARGQTVRVGETIPYVICLEPGQEESSSKSKGYAERAHHPDEVKMDDSELKIDVEWYLSNQILGPVARLCAPMDGTSSSRIAECLGLDASKFKAVTAGYEVGLEVQNLASTMTDEERFKNVDKWSITCFYCDTVQDFELIREDEAKRISCGISCKNPECQRRMPLASLNAQLVNQISTHILRYQAQLYVCDDQTCGNKTHQVSVQGKACMVNGCRGNVRQDYSYQQLFLQLDYYDWLVNLERWSSKHEGDKYDDSRNILQSQYSTDLADLRKTVQRYMGKSSHFLIGLGDMYRSIGLVRQDRIGAITA